MIASPVQKIDPLEALLKQNQVGGGPIRLLAQEVESLRQQLELVQAEGKLSPDDCIAWIQARSAL